MTRKAKVRKEAEVTESPESTAEVDLSRYEQAVQKVEENAEELAESRSEFVLERIQRVRAEISDRFLELGMLLEETHRERYWVDRNFNSFEEFCEGTVQVKHRTALYLISIYQHFMQNLDIPRPLLAEVGWTKLKELVGVTDDENVNEWLSYAKDHKTSEVVKRVKETRRSEEPNSGNAPVEEYVNFNCGVFAPELEIINRALEICQRETSSDRKGHNMSLICADYIAGAEAATEAIDVVPEETDLSEVPF